MRAVTDTIERMPIIGPVETHFLNVASGIRIDDRIVIKGRSANWFAHLGIIRASVWIYAQQMGAMELGGDAGGPFVENLTVRPFEQLNELHKALMRCGS